MGLFNFFKPNQKNTPNDNTDEEYQLPELSKKRFPMTDELRRREENERLKRKYGISVKEGDFI